MIGGTFQWDRAGTSRARHTSDATETAKLVDRYPDQLFVTLVRIQAKNGDVAVEDSDMAQSAETAPSAWNDAKVRHSADAYKDIESGECDCKIVSSVHLLAGDPEGASQAMRSCPTLAEISMGMAELAKQSAERGDVSHGLKFADSVHVIVALRYN